MSTINTDKRILDLPCPLTPDALEEILGILDRRYPQLNHSTLGRSILGREISMMRLGHGSPTVVWVGGQSGTDAISAAILTRFINEYSELLLRRGRLYGCTLPYLAELRAVCVAPMLNPDGIAYATEGVAENHLLRERLLNLNGGSEDFSGWQANARGVDLRCNYAADLHAFMQRKQTAQSSEHCGDGRAVWCGEAPESEPESAALCRYLRAMPDLGLLLELRSGERCVIQPKGADRRSTTLGRILGRLCGMRVVESEGGTLCDWVSSELGTPAFSLCCGTGNALFELYAGVRELLFVAPTLVGK